MVKHFAQDTQERNRPIIYRGGITVDDFGIGTIRCFFHSVGTVTWGGRSH